MERAEVIRRLKACEPELRALGVAALYLFGSYARDGARPDSDIDVFVNPADADHFDLIRFSRSSQIVEDRFPGTEVSYSRRDQIVPTYLSSIGPDAVQVF